MIIGVSGKIGSGKDTVGEIVKFLLYKEYFKKDEYVQNLKYIPKATIPYIPNNFIVKKYADKLKDIVCLLINCTREDLENHEFKDKELGEEWIRYGYADGFIHGGKVGQVVMNNKTCSKERYEEELRTNWQTAYKSTLTPRLIFQLLGTQCGRDIIHNNIWVNSLMSEYKIVNEELRQSMGNIIDYSRCFPNWIITDVRFPNEARAIEDKGGINIRVNREIWIDIKYLTSTTTFPIDLKTKNNNEELIHRNIQHYENGRYYYNNNANVVIEEIVTHFRKVDVEHESETALDDYNFKYTIGNNGTIEDLIENVKEILILEKIICQ